MSMSDRDGFIWYDGKLVPWRSATTHVLTHSLHYGLAVFEGLRAYKTVNGTAIFRLKEHTDRWVNSRWPPLRTAPAPSASTLRRTSPKSESARSITGRPAYFSR